MRKKKEKQVKVFIFFVGVLPVIPKGILHGLTGLKKNQILLLSRYYNKEVAFIYFHLFLPIVLFVDINYRCFLIGNIAGNYFRN